MSYTAFLILMFYGLSTLALLMRRFLSRNVGGALAYFSATGSFVTAALRPASFPDVDSYETMFDFASTGEFSNPFYWASHGEPGFKVLGYILSTLGVTFPLFLAFFSGLSFLLLVAISRQSKISFVYLWFCYFSIFFVTRDLGVIRLSIASHLIVLFFLSSRSWIGYVSLLIASLGFQFFAVVSIFVKFIARFKTEWLSIFLLFFCSMLLSSIIDFEFLQMIIPDRQSTGYVGTLQSSSGGSGVLVPIMRNSIFAAIIFYLLRNERNLYFYRIWVWSALISVAIYILASGVLIVGQRFSAYFGAIVPIALAYILSRDTSTYGDFWTVTVICCVNFSALFYFNDFIYR